MKHYNPFDYYENDENKIDENTVFEETGVSYENIKNTVFENINKSKRKRRKKAPLIALVAIIAVIASISTVAAYATGKFSDVFGYLFSGEYENGFYSGCNAKIECSDDSLNVEVLGITAGNEHEVYIAYQITKKDGTAFEFAGNGVNGGEIDLEFTNIEVDFPFDGYFAGGSSGYSFDCIMADEKTILVYVSYEASATIRGNKIHIDFGEIVFSCVDKYLGEYIEGTYNTKDEVVLEECEPVNGSTESSEYHAAVNARVNELQNIYGYEIMDEVIGSSNETFFMIKEQCYVEVREENGKDIIYLVTFIDDINGYQDEYDRKVKELSELYELNDMQKIGVVYNAEIGKKEFCIETVKKFDATIKSEMYLNYKVNKKKSSIDDKIANDINEDIFENKCAEISNLKLVISPFSIQFSADASGIMKDDSGQLVKNESGECEKILRMKDGTEHHLDAIGGEYSTDKNGRGDFVENFIIYRTNGVDNDKMTVLDINNLKEIQIGDVVIPL